MALTVVPTLLALCSMFLILAAGAAQASSGAVAEFSLPSGSEPAGITAGPEGDIWFAETGSGRIGRISGDGQISEFEVGRGSEPRELTFGPDGQIWFTEASRDQIGSLSAGGEVAIYEIDGAAAGITADPDGDICFTEPSVGEIGCVNPGGQVTEFPVTTAAAEPRSITVGAEGALWFTEDPTAESVWQTPGPGRVGRMAVDGQISEFPLSSEFSYPGGITAGPEGDIWFSEGGSAHIGRISQTGEITEFPGAKVYSASIAVGPEEHVWFAADGGLGFVAPGGQITNLPISPEPGDIVVAPDGAVWFTADAGDGESPLIGRFTPDLPLQPRYVPEAPTMRSGQTGCAELTGSSCFQPFTLSSESAVEPSSESASPESAAALPAKFFGLQFGGDYPEEPAEVEAVKRSGAKYWRFNFGCLEAGHWEGAEHEMQYAWEHGLTVIADLATNCKGGREYPTEAEYAPKGSEWEKWAYELIQHFGAKGSFWSGKANPLPLTIFEVWNEPNRGVNNPGGKSADAKLYAKFLKRTSSILHTASEGSTITVLMGGLLALTTGHEEEKAENPTDLSVHDFLEGVAEVPGLNYNGVAIHPYAFAAGHEVENVITNITTARKNINEFSGEKKTMWITEVGWPVERGDKAHPNVSKERQKVLLTGVFNWIKAHANENLIKSLVYYNYRDFDTENLSWEEGCGLRSLLRSSVFSEVTFRPSWYGFQGETGATRWPVPPVAVTLPVKRPNAYETMLNGELNTHGLPTEYFFEYGTTTSYGSVTSRQLANYKEGVVTVEGALMRLSNETTYHFRLVTRNENAEVSYGADQQFTTPGVTR